MTLARSAGALMGALWIAAAFPGPAPGQVGGASGASAMTDAHPPADPNPAGLTLFLCGDVMTGRGIDQVLPHPGDPALHEAYVQDARGYVRLAEAASGPVPAPVDFAYVWGEALGELARAAPAVRIVNLETSVTRGGAPWPGKGIHYRMHPDNLPVLTAARVDIAVLANNHVLDWGVEGLRETLETLAAAGIATAGAGRDLEAARSPAVAALPGGGRLLVFAWGLESSGIPAAWGATDTRAGVHRLADLGDRSLRDVRALVARFERPGDLVVASIHWGGNWGYAVPPEQRAFAHGLIERAGVDLVHGHSSHHVRPMEVHQGKLILYGCGDFINDYEGIGGYADFRPELALMYFPTLDPATGRLLRLEMTATRMRRLQRVRASAAETGWLAATLTREGAALGTRVAVAGPHRLVLVGD